MKRQRLLTDWKPQIVSRVSTQLEDFVMRQDVSAIKQLELLFSRSQENLNDGEN